ncbi:hypothetical protein INT43_005157 [Umbelopsis isabellina]|uniref:Uncharacterized protein n=1 Tax=Mortierella isabellina TaxID=91625 RepID=A0A8H7U9V1_MORIS|nr:hypothetical protein INT43_005157 [Umbelopsis isabellina]
MLDRFAVWDSAYQSWHFEESRAILLDVNGTALGVTDLETMRQLMTHTLSMEGDLCKMEKFQLLFQSSAACLEVFDVVKSLAPCQIFPEVPSKAGICKTKAADKRSTSSIVQPSSEQQQMQPALATNAHASQMQQPKREYEQQKHEPEQRQPSHPLSSGGMLPLYTQGQIQHHQQLHQALANNENGAFPSMHPLMSTEPSVSTQPLTTARSHQQQEKQVPLSENEMLSRELPVQLPVIDRTRIHRILHDPLFPAIVRISFDFCKLPIFYC